MLPTIWFCLVGLALATYVVLDGFDLGAGVLHLVVAKTPAERRAIVKSIGPVWDGNEVWLVTGGASLYLAFPKLFAVAFSGFYLPLMMVLWLLIGRALGIEMRHHLDHPIWNQLWDAAFCAASATLTIVLGAALGNVVRGVSITKDGTFFAPLWTDLGMAGDVGVLDWYTLLVGVTALAVLSLHGALWIAWRVGGAVTGRADRLVRPLCVASGALLAITTAATISVQPMVLQNLVQRPWGAVLPALAAGGITGVFVMHGRGDPRRAFFSSCAFLYGLLGSAAFGIYPYLLPGRTDGRGLTIESAAAHSYGLGVGLMWWIPGMALAVGYFVFLYRRLPARVEPTDDPH